MKKKILSVLLRLLSISLASAVVFGACSIASKEIDRRRFMRFQQMWLDRLERYDRLCEKTDSETYIGFEASDAFDSEGFSFAALKDIQNYRSVYADCNTYTMYETLSEADKIIYRAFEYALDHHTNIVFFEEELIDGDTDFVNIAMLFSLDSPLMEQNITYGYDRDPNEPATVTIRIDDDEFGTVEREVRGYEVNIKNFSGTYAEAQMQAYENAEARVAAMPEGLSDMEKAEYLYRDLCKSTRYAERTNYASHKQLYDALVGGEAICDGFANALSLMYNLAGIPCFEKIYKYKGTKPGHTWNCFFADGKWYNADATYENGLDESDPVDALLTGFAFSDSFESVPHDHSDILPIVCSDDTLYKDRQYVAKSDAQALIGALIDSYKNSGLRAGCVITDSLTDGELDALERMLSNDARAAILNTYYFLNVEYDGKDALLLVNAENAE